MHLPEFNFGTVFLLVVIWTAVAVVFGLLIGQCIAEADAAELADDEDDSTWLDDAPTDVLSAAEIDRRIERLEAQLRHPSSRNEWLA